MVTLNDTVVNRRNVDRLGSKIGVGERQHQVGKEANAIGADLCVGIGRDGHFDVAGGCHIEADVVRIRGRCHQVGTLGGDRISGFDNIYGQQTAVLQRLESQVSLEQPVKAIATTSS